MRSGALRHRYGCAESGMRTTANPTWSYSAPEYGRIGHTVDRIRCYRVRYPFVVADVRIRPDRIRVLLGWPMCVYGEIVLRSTVLGFCSSALRPSRAKRPTCRSLHGETHQSERSPIGEHLDFFGGFQIVVFAGIEIPLNTNPRPCLR